MVAPAAAFGLAAAAALTQYLPAEIRALSGSGLPVHTILAARVLVFGLSAVISFVPCLRMWRMPVALVWLASSGP